MTDTARIKYADTGGWVPPERVIPPPIFAWPPRPLGFLKYLFGMPGYLFPWNVFYVGTAALLWFYAMPDLASMQALEVGWLAQLLAINLVQLILFTSAFHVRLYVQRAQDTAYKFNTKWPKDSPAFLFRNQHRDNIFWTLVSGVPIATLFQGATLWAMANDWIPVVAWADHPVYLALIMLATQIFRDVHFYCIHRLIHWPPLYRAVHYLHHKNTNPGPWSGLAMHPVEHVLYFSSLLIHWFVPSHPLLVIYHLQAALFGPARDHCGFSSMKIHGARHIPAASYMHYLHHRYFEVNYGDSITPIDLWIGTWHDGSREAHAAMKQRVLAKKVTHVDLTA